MSQEHSVPYEEPCSGGSKSLDNHGGYNVIGDFKWYAEYGILFLIIMMLQEVGALKYSFKMGKFWIIYCTHYWRRLSRKQKLTLFFIFSMGLGLNAHKRLIMKFIIRKKRSKFSRRMRRAMAMQRSRSASKHRKLLRNQSGLFDFLKGIRVGEASNEGPGRGNGNNTYSARRNITGGHGKSEPPSAALWQLSN